MLIIGHYLPCLQLQPYSQHFLIYNAFVKGRLRATIFESAETAHLILLCYFGDAIGWAMSAEKKMVARNRPLDFIIALAQKYQFFVQSPTGATTALDFMDLRFTIYMISAFQRYATLFWGIFFKIRFNGSTPIQAVQHISK